MDVPRSLVETFVTVTNAEPSVASQLLGDNGLDLEAAIASFFAIQEAGGGPVPGGPPATQTLPSAVVENADDADVQVVANDSDGDNDTPMDASAAQSTAAAALAADEAFARQLAAESGEEEVRAPIPDRVDQILPGTGTGRGGARPSRRAYAVDDPFLHSDGTMHGDMLASLFRPPELNSRDDLDTAMSKGQSEKKWLLVNMQRTGVFPCHMLNRDVWSDPAVCDLVESRFILWQRDENTDDGKRYKQFYPYGEPPHVAIVDPRSGERLRVWGGDGRPIEKDVLVNGLVDFCDAESLDDDGPGRHRLPAGRPAAASTRPTVAPDVMDRDRDAMEAEDAAIAAAIAASMEQSSSGDMGGAGGAAAGASEDVRMPGVAQEAGGSSDMFRTSRSALNSDRQASRLLSATDPGLNHDRSLRAQQDSEYEQSLALDRAKTESEKAEADRVERVAGRLEAKRSRIPSPPPVDCGEPTTELVIRLPSGKRLQRRFYGSNTIGNVYDFVDVENGNELTEDSYTLVVPFPRTAFTDRNMTLVAADLLRKAALVVDLH